jgi:glycolate oxidase
MSGNPDEIHRVHEAVAEIFSYAVRLGGTVSGEHGIGLTKKTLSS